MAEESLTVLALNCSLKSANGKEQSSTQLMLEQLLEAFAGHGAAGDIVRVVDLDIKPGITSDEGEGDDWPDLRERLISADILVVGSPVWLGQPSSVAKRVCERLDAFIGEKDDKARMPSYGKVACVAVVGNEDGAHHVAGELHAALNEVGFTIPANGVTYWVGEALGSTDYKDLKKTPKTVAGMTAMLASNAAHLARLLKPSNYPGT